MRLRIEKGRMKFCKMEYTISSRILRNISYDYETKPIEKFVKYMTSNEMTIFVISSRIM